MWGSCTHLNSFFPSSLPAAECINCLQELCLICLGPRVQGREQPSSDHDVPQLQHTNSQLQRSFGWPWLRGKHLPTLLCFQRAHSYFTGHAGGGHFCLELAGACDHPKGEDIPPGAP